MWGDRGTRQSRGYGRAWQAARAAAMARDSHLCVVCAKAGIITPATEVDHIIPKAKGGTDGLRNLQSLCRPCHKAKTTREGAEGRGAKPSDGRMQRSDGW